MVITGFAIRYKKVCNCHVQSELYEPLQNSNFKCARHHPLNTFGLEIATHPLSSSHPPPHSHLTLVRLLSHPSVMPPLHSADGR